MAPSAFDPPPCCGTCQWWCRLYGNPRHPDDDSTRPGAGMPGDRGLCYRITTPSVAYPADRRSNDPKPMILRGGRRTEDQILILKTPSTFLCPLHLPMDATHLRVQWEDEPDGVPMPRLISPMGPGGQD